MNIEEYIASGILESYVLGELSPKEEEEVLSMLEKHPEIREELHQVEETLEMVARHAAVKAPAGARARLMDSIEDSSSSSASRDKVIPLTIEKREPVLYKYVAAASVVLAIITSFLAFNYWSNWREAETELSTLIAQNQQIADNYNQVNEELEALARDVAVLNDSAFSRIPLSGTGNSPSSYATVYWNDRSEQVFLSIRNLEELSKDQQYQLWAIIDGVPVDAGVFDVQEGLVQLKNIPRGATAFAVTVEPAGGSENPTLESMKLMGPVSEG